MYYIRKIKYLDLLADGEKVRGAGFVKIEIRDDICNLQVCVNKIHAAQNLERKVLLKAADRERVLCNIKIKDGRGDTGVLKLCKGNLANTGISYDKLGEIIIPINSGMEIKCAFNENIEMKAADASQLHAAEIMPAAAMRDEAEKMQTSTVMRDEAEKMQTSTVMRDEAEKMQTSTVMQDEAEKMQTSEVMQEESKDSEIEREGQDDGHIREVLPLEDKWRQLSSLYPHIKPTGEIKDCIRIKPADFVILSNNSYGLVNNSFLLHGYHNYKHLILARMESRGDIKYYVGVPGVFFEREKQVALMFGFESFESGNEMTRQGDFGYYMIRVNI